MYSHRGRMGTRNRDTNLTRFGYRDYDAYTGKWAAKDPIGFSGGDSNLYGYVLGNPVGFVDLLGLDPRLNGKVGKWGGADRELDPNADRNSNYFKALGYIAVAEVSIFKYGIKKTFEGICFIVLETQSIDEGRLRRPRPSPPRTEVRINWKKLIPKKYKKLLGL